MAMIDIWEGAPIKDALVQIDFNATIRAKSQLQGSPEKHLQFAVLKDAVATIELGITRRPKSAEIYRDTLHWVKSTENDWPFSFIVICESLGFDPSKMRAGILAIAKNRRPIVDKRRIKSL